MESCIIPSLLVCLIVSLWCILYWWPRRRLWSLAEKIPGPRGYPLIGGVFEFIGKPTENLPQLMKLFADYGQLFSLWFGPRLVVFMSDPDDIQVILGDPKIRNRERVITKSMEKFFGNGLFSLRGDRWKIHRKLITPTFHFNILECFIEVFGRKSKILVDKLEEFEGTSFNVYKTLALCTLDSICETAIGTAINSQDVGRNDFVDSIHKCMILIREYVLRPWLWVEPIFHLSSIGRQSKPLIKTNHEFSESVITQKLDEFRRGVRSPGITTSSNKRVSSFLDMLIEASETQGSILSPEEIRDEVTTMAVAGIETTAGTMSFLLVLISIHPEVQAELHRELDDVFGSDDRPATSEDLKHLPVMERCIKETLRLFPIAMLLPRELDNDVHLPSGYTIPASSCVIITTYATHRDPCKYNDPQKFRPDRWLPENSKDLHPYAYLPFSAGPRNCIGQKYAQLQMKSILSQVLRRYRVTTPLTMESLQRLELSVSLCLDHTLEKQYCIQLHKR